MSKIRFVNFNKVKIAKLEARSLIDHRKLLRDIDAKNGSLVEVADDGTRITATRIGPIVITTYEPNTGGNTLYMKQTIIYNPEQTPRFIGSAEIEIETSKDRLKNPKTMSALNKILALSALSAERRELIKELKGTPEDILAYFISKGLQGVINPPEVIRIRKGDWLTKISKSRWNDLDWRRYLRATKQTLALRKHMKFNPWRIYEGDTFEIIQGRPTSGSHWA